MDDEWEDEGFLDELFRVQDEAVASRNPNPTPSPASAPAPSPPPAPAPAPDPFPAAASVSHPLPAASTPASYLPATSTPASYLPAGSARASYLPATSSARASYLPAPSVPYSPSPALRFSPPRELTQPPADDEARGFSPPRELSQRPVADEVDSAIVVVPGPTCDRYLGKGGGGGTKREREARELERLKRELNRVSKQMNDLKNECTELRKDKTKKDLQIKAREAEIQNLKKANVGLASKDGCGVLMDTDRPVQAPANGALHAASAGGWASTMTDRPNGKVKEANSMREDLCWKQRYQTDLPESLELKHRTMIDNTTSTSGAVYFEEGAHRSMECKEIKAIGVQTDNRWNSEHLDGNKVLVERISSNLRAIWGMPANNLSGRNMISKIIVSCSEEILALLKCTGLSDKCVASSEASSSMSEAISELYELFIKMNNEKIPIQTFLEALLNLCSFENAAIVGRTLRILHRILQHMLSYGIKSNESVPSGTMFLLKHILTYTWRTITKTDPPC